MTSIPPLALALLQDTLSASDSVRAAAAAGPSLWSELTSIPPMAWLIGLGTGVGTALALAFVLRVLIRRFERIAALTTTDVDDLILHLLKSTRRLFVFLVAVWAGARVVDLPPAISSFVHGLLVVGLFFQFGLWATGVVNHLLDRYRRAQLAVDPTSATALGALSFVVRTAVWVIVVLLVFDNLGFDVTALITGLGIGGIAIALAVQNVLGDLFASLAIVLDKPFVVGDFIAVDGMNGTVEHVGVKTTRVRSLSGEQLVFGNAKLLGSSIRNYGRLRERRIVFVLGVEYGTPRAKLEQIPVWLRETVEGLEQARFDRAHLRSFGDSAIEFETVYYVLAPEYNVYMDLQQAINLRMHQIFERENISFAFPSRTLYLRGLEGVERGLSRPGSEPSDPGGYEAGSRG